MVRRPRDSFYNFFFILEQHLTMPGISLDCIQGSSLVVLRRPHMVSGIKPGPDICNKMIYSCIVSLAPLSQCFLVRWAGSSMEGNYQTVLLGSCGARDNFGHPGCAGGPQGCTWWWLGDPWGTKDHTRFCCRQGMCLSLWSAFLVLWTTTLKWI